MTPRLEPAARGLLCVALAVLVHGFAPPPDSLRLGLALFALIGALWISQALHLAVTALLVPLLAALAGLMDVRSALSSFANPVIFLFLGGFALAAALQAHRLDRALALAMLRLARGRRPLAVLLLFGLTAVLSLWMSNTATAAMMLPLALGLLQDSTRDGTSQGRAVGPRETAFVLLGLAYSASIGGIGTLVGSPPNAIAAAQAGIGFAQWLRIGLPLVALLLPLMVGVLYVLLRPQLGGRVSLAHEPLDWTRERRLVVLIFALTAGGWVAGAPIGRLLGVEADIDSVIAVAAIVALAATGAVPWPEIERRTQWGVLLLFGGGLALSQAMSASGASQFLGGQVVEWLKGAPAFLVLLGVVAFVVFLTELVSNTATAALLVPIFLGVGATMGLSPVVLAASIAVSSSCAFMLPVATPPNAIAFATGQVPQSTMVTCGLALNLVCIAVITAVVPWLV